MVRRVVFAVLLTTISATAQNTPMSPDKALQLGRECAQKVLTGNATDLWAKFSPQMKAALKDESAWKSFAESVPKQIGKETQQLNERVMPMVAVQTCERLFKTDAVPFPLTFNVSFSPDGSIAGLFVKPLPNPAESTQLDYKTKTPLRLPFRGEWTIYWGGRTTYDDYHSVSVDQRFAYDIDIEKDGRQFNGDGTKVQDFYAFGQPILATAAGTVVVAEDKYDDNPVMKPSSSGPAQGNTVVIDHGDGEFSMYAHLKRGSVKVKAGDPIKAGQQISECGNSGNSPVPHLHYHLQSTSMWFNGEGLPAAFHDFSLNGKHIDLAEPVRGDKVKADG